MIVNYRVWLYDRENPQKKMQFIKPVFFVTDIMETAHNLLIFESCGEYKCYRIDLVSITDFTL